MVIGFETTELTKTRLSFAPKQVQEHKVKADTLELELRTPVSYAPYRIRVTLGTRANLLKVPLEGCWEGKIDLGHVAQKEAEERFEAIRSQVEKGDYIAHKYDNGTLELELI